MLLQTKAVTVLSHAAVYRFLPSRARKEAVFQFLPNRDRKEAVSNTFKLTAPDSLTVAVH